MKNILVLCLFGFACAGVQASFSGWSGSGSVSGSGSYSGRGVVGSGFASSGVTSASASRSDIVAPPAPVLTSAEKDREIAALEVAQDRSVLVIERLVREKEQQQSCCCMSVCFTAICCYCLGYRKAYEHYGMNAKRD